MNEKLAKAFKLAMGEEFYNKWVEASDKLERNEINYEEYERMVSGNHTLIFDVKRSKITFIDRDKNETRVGYFDY